MRAITIALILASTTAACDDDSQSADLTSADTIGDASLDVPGADQTPLTEAGGDTLPTPDLPPKTDQGTPGGKTCTVDISCTTTADCTAKGLLDCVNGKCVQCKVAGDCMSFFKGCSATGFCQVCLTDADCPATIGTGKCDPIISNCTLCDSDADCANAGPATTKYCVQIPTLHGNTKMCVGCKADADCANATLKRCDTATGACALCKTDADCCTLAANCGMTCDTTSGECRCATDQQCQAGYMSKMWKCQ